MFASRITNFFLRMTFDPISYVYVPTVPRSKSTKSGHKIAKNLSTPKMNQHIQPGARMVDTERSSVAADGDGDVHDESRAEGGFCLDSFHSS